MKASSTPTTRASYNGVPARARQSCLAHPLRAAREALQTLDAWKNDTVVDEPSQRFMRQVKALLVEACQMGRKLRHKPLSRQKADELQERFLGRLMRLSAPQFSWEPAEQLRSRLRKQRKNLFTFIAHPEVEPTNNQAEQSLRRSVILRKVTFGNRSAEGARRQAMLMSLITTAQRQGRDARAALETLWTEPVAVAQAAFYRQKPAPKNIRREKNASARRPQGNDPPKTS